MPVGYVGKPGSDARDDLFRAERARLPERKGRRRPPPEPAPVLAREPDAAAASTASKSDLATGATCAGERTARQLAMHPA